MASIIEVEHLAHRYGRRTIYEDLHFEVPEGKIYGLLGKNGVGKTTLIKILMGFLRPAGGHCRVLGQDSHSLSPETRARIGLLFEGHLAYEFMTIAQIERFHAPFYPRWRREVFYDLVDRLKLPHDHRVGNMSCGQRSQVVLGLLMAQQPDLLILDDYSMGLDAGYRRLFLDYLGEYLADGKKTVFLTSHVIQDMERYVDEVLFLERGGRSMTISLPEFLRTFRCYSLPRNGQRRPPAPESRIKNVETHADRYELFSFRPLDDVAEALGDQGVDPAGLREKAMDLEDAFIGFTGRS